MKKFVFLFVFFWGGFCTAAAADVPDNMYFRAMQDEMKRSLSQLRVKGSPKPYYLAYRLRYMSNACSSASLGKLTENDTQPYWSLMAGAVLSAGTPKSDSMGFVNSLSFSYDPEKAYDVPNSYWGIRRAFWKLTDSGYVNALDRFEKKLHDLELTRMVSIQMAPQIRLVQNNDTLMAEKIQSSLVNTIPLWKSQMVLALGLENSRQAMEAQRAVTDMTNDLLRKNAEALKQGTIATAKESERGVVDIETLQNTNKKLIETLDEVMKIQNEGREKRRAAEAELGRIEGELKAKLTDINQ